MAQLIKAIGTAVRAARLKQGLSQERLAELAGLDRTYISGLERGVRNPTLSSLEQVCEGLGLTFRELVILADRLG